jgi:intracellular multiplication protein IcmD
MYQKLKGVNNKRRLIKPLFLILSFVFSGALYATTGDLSSLSSQIFGNFANLSKLITAGAYIAGLGFAIASIFKFKAHKDNPTQVQVGTPIALVMIAASLLFLPSILGTTGKTLFGSTATSATDTGVAWTPG